MYTRGLNKRPKGHGLLTWERVCQPCSERRGPIFWVAQGWRDFVLQNTKRSRSSNYKGLHGCVLFASILECPQLKLRIIPASILHKSTAGRYQPVRVADGPITVRYRFMYNAYWDHARARVRRVQIQCFSVRKAKALIRPQKITNLKSDTEKWITNNRLDWVIWVFVGQRERKMQ